MKARHSNFTCTENNCDRPVHARNVCNKHYIATYKNRSLCLMSDCKAQQHANAMCKRHNDMIVSHQDFPNNPEVMAARKSYFDGLWEFTKKELKLA